MNYLAEIRKSRGLSRAQLADLMNTTEVSIGRYEREDSRLNIPLMERLAEALGTTVGEIVGSEPVSDGSSVQIPEYDVRVSAGGGFHIDTETQKDTWPFSRSYIEGELRLNTSQLVILEVIGDSMAPTLQSGDRVLVNMADTRISQPGIFVLWDGDGTVVKRLEMIPGSEPAKIRRISDNPLHGDYEVLAQETNIIGRVVWYARRM